MVGLWGQGGVGKTTLAKAIYNAVFREFHGSSFLECVRENSKNSKDLVHLQEKVLSMLLLGKKSTIYSVAEGSRLIQDRLCNKKVLVILDDVDDECQLNALAGNCEWFGKGSRVIITTRNRHLLTSHGVDYYHIYEVKALENGEALELFKNHAFRGNKKIEVSSNLVDSVLHYASGLPLALGVLGSFLCGRGEREWESTLQKLAKSPDKKINDVLKVGYEGLEEYVKEIFLDIACFFKGWSTSNIKKVLDICDFPTTIGIQILIERSLISEVRGTLQMHDLIQLMGTDIVKEECCGDLDRQSRLWLYDDVLHVLSGDAGTSAVKAIVLMLPKPKKMDINPYAFKNMKKLRLLILHNVRNSSQDFIHLPNELRWLEWPRCASTPRFNHGPKKLVALDLQNSNIEGVLEQFKDFKKLKFINFSGCQCLVRMPNLSFIPDLEELNLSGCKNLERVHKSVARLYKLRSLNLSGCSPLLSLPDVLVSENLETLALANCSKVQKFPIIPNNTKCLRELNLKGTSIKELPASVGDLVYLKRMDLTNCKELSILPPSIYRLRNLESLDLTGCSKLIKFPKEEIKSDPSMKAGFPNLINLYLTECNLSEVEFLENPSCFPSLMGLHLEGNNFTSLPACGHLYNLAWLYVGQNNQLQEIHEIPRKLIELYADGCKSLSKISSFIGDIETVKLGSCHELDGNVTAIYDFECACLKKGNTEVTFPGEKMPKWLIPNDDGYISLMVSEDLLKKFLKVAVCIVFRVKEGERRAFLETSKEIQSAVGHTRYFNWDSDHVWLACEEALQDLSNGEFSGPNDWRCFKVTTRVSASAIVKKCGFRFICKPLENDWEVFLRHNQSLNPDLIYEVRHEGIQMSTWLKIPSEAEDSQESKTSREKDSSSEDNSSVASISIEEHRYSLIHPDYRNVHPGGEMPEEFILVEDGTISFMASQNLYDKILGLALCAVFGVEDGENEVSFSIVPSINGQRRNALLGTLGSFDSDHVWIQFLKSNVLWGLLEGGIDFGQFEESYLQFNLRIEVLGGTMKRLGYVIICRQLEDDLKVVVEDNQLVTLASLCEISYEPEYAFIEHEKLINWWRQFREKVEANMHIEELEASDSDSEPDKRWSGACSSETD